MKTLTGLLLIGLFAFASSCDQETPEKAKTYFTTIVSKVDTLTQNYEKAMIKSFSNFIPEEMEAKYTALEKNVAQLKKELNEMEAFYGDETLLNDAKAVAAAYESVLPLYKKAVKNESLDQSEYTDDNAKIYDDLMAEIDATLNPPMDKFLATNLSFGAAHKVTIRPSSLEENK